MSWVKRNLTNFLSFLAILLTIVGLLATFYFSLIYYPGLREDIRQEKIRRINESLIEATENIIFEGAEFSSRQIDALIKGTELRFGLDYPHTTTDLLVQTQQSFLNNKFIPLNRRQELFLRIQKQIDQILKEKETGTRTAEPRPALGLDMGSLFVSIVGTLFAIFSVIGAAIRFRRERDYEIFEEVEQHTERIEDRVTQEFRFENAIHDILVSMNLPMVSRDWSSSSREYDLQVSTKNKKYIIEVKHFIDAGRIKESVIDRLSKLADKIGAEVILIANRELTADARSRLEHHNMESASTFVHTIISDKLDQIRLELQQILLGTSP